jgi:hypothetical protein
MRTGYSATFVIDVPIEQPTKFELVINMKTAKLLGLDLPNSIARRRDDRGEPIMSVLRFVSLFVVMLALTGCPGPNYAPYNNMRNSYG